MCARHYSLIVITAVMVLGITNNIYKLYKLKRDQKLIEDFFSRLFQLIEMMKKKEDGRVVLSSILADGKNVSGILKESMYNMPILDIVTGFTYGNLRFNEFQDKVSRAVCNLQSQNAQIDKTIKKVSWQFANPFVLFYEGIELVVYISFGYLIEKFDSDFSTEKKWWKFLNIIISVFGSVASVYGLFK